MGYNLEIIPKAELDTENAIDYYFAINIDLAVQFNDELYVVYDKITTNPLYYKYLSKRKEKKFRCARLKSFPYLVIYGINGSTIVVISVFNTHRKPVLGQP